MTGNTAELDLLRSLVGKWRRDAAQHDQVADKHRKDWYLAGGVGDADSAEWVHREAARRLTRCADELETILGVL
jgi:hypothetical protein